MRRLVLVIGLLMARFAWAQTGAVQGYCTAGATSVSVSGLQSTNKAQGIIPYCTGTVYVHGWSSPVAGTYVSGATVVGAVNSTCLLTFDGGNPAGTASIKLTGTNTINSGTQYSPVTWGNYASTPATATLSSGTATCSGTVAITAALGPSPSVIYADGSNTPLGNPFTASSLGYWSFYAAVGLSYDVALSGGRSPLVYPSPVALSALPAISTGGLNVVYRCVTAGAVLPTGSLTIDAAACGSSQDTGMRAQ